MAAHLVRVVLAAVAVGVAAARVSGTQQLPPRPPHGVLVFDSTSSLVSEDVAELTAELRELPADEVMIAIVPAVGDPGDEAVTVDNGGSEQVAQEYVKSLFEKGGCGSGAILVTLGVRSPHIGIAVGASVSDASTSNFLSEAEAAVIAETVRPVYTSRCCSLCLCSTSASASVRASLGSFVSQADGATG